MKCVGCEKRNVEVRDGAFRQNGHVNQPSVSVDLGGKTGVVRIKAITRHEFFCAECIASGNHKIVTTDAPIEGPPAIPRTDW